MIYFITKLEAQRLLTPDEHGTYHGPRPGMEFDWYLVFDDPGWTAIDNSSGEAWTEDFKTIEEAVRWLESNQSKEDMEEDEEDEEPTALANSGVVDRAPEIVMERLKASAEEHHRHSFPDAGHERDYSEDDGTTGNLSYDFETAFDQDRLLHLHKSDVELTELITDFYEKETGKSCVYWYCPRSKDYDCDQWKDVLPRQDDYETNGYTDDFWKWMREIEDKAIEAGVENIDEMASFFLGYLMPEAAEKRGKEVLKQVEQLEPPEDDGQRKIRLYELLPLVLDPVRIDTVTESGAWSARYSCGDEALKKMQGSPDLLDSVVEKVLAYTPMCSMTNGTICASEPSHVVILLASGE